MRHLKTVVQLSVMWVLVFVMAAGPLPLGIPSAQAAPVTGITDTPGIQNFYTPRLFIIFDTSRSMSYRPNDPNSDPSVVGQDWDPTVPTPDAQCENKFCLGKRALYKTLPEFTSRIEMGLSGYNQYYQLTTQPADYYTTCWYDRIALGSTAWQTYWYNVPDDLTGTGTNPGLLGAASPVVNTPPRNSSPPYAPFNPIPHRTRKEFANPRGLAQYRNVVGAGASAGATLSYGGYTYTWDQRFTGAQDSLLKSGPTCPNNVPSFTGGSCGSDPCDLYLIGQHINPYPPVWFRSDQGNSLQFNGVTYTRSGPTVSTFTDQCGLPSPYNGGQVGCNGVQGGCNLTKTNGPYGQPTGASETYYDNYNPGPGWQKDATNTGSVQVQLTTYGLTCPAIGTVVTANSGPAAWRSLATGGSGPGTATTDCANSPGSRCTWTMVQDLVVAAESNAHYCVFQRPEYVWNQYQQLCDYKTTTYRYDTNDGDHYCDYRHNVDEFIAPTYWYSYLPNDGDIIGGTYVNFYGNDDSAGLPTAYPYSNGSFTNGDCPNLIANSPTNGSCQGSAICKLSWESNTTIGATNYPAGRYSNGGGWWWWQSQLYPAADPPGNLTDPLFPPNPLAYRNDWLQGGGQGVRYYVNLEANYFNPSASNPPNPPLFTCPNCTYQYSYQDPGLQLDSATKQVLPASQAAAPGAFATVARAMPARRTSGWARLDDATPALSWQPLATDNAITGGSPASDGPLLRMLSKYDPTTNPNGIRIPDYGDYTPLSGALINVKSYLQGVIDSDPYAGCGRKYFVMLLTDGEEYPDTIPAPANDPVGAVTALRGMTTSGGVAVDVKTFVIGFGLLGPSAQLDAMAQAGGTAVSPTDFVTPDSTSAGVALDGSDYTRLLSSLNVTFGKILSGYFTRSRPTANIAATELYVGYFNFLQNGTEWQGKLDALDIDGQNLPSFADTVTPNNYNTFYKYLWRYGYLPGELGGPGQGSSINSQQSRTVYTSLNPNTGSKIFFDYSGCAGCASPDGWNSNGGGDQTNLETLIDSDPQVARSTIALLLNPGGIGNPERFTSGVRKRSRASDIFHSNPAIVEGAAQSTGWPDGTESAAYQAFKNTVLNRRKTVFIGANDGMLHAIEDAVTSPGAVVAPEAGQERWGYVPNSLLPRLKAMRDAHSYGVDGSFGVADVCGPGFSLSTCADASGAGWKTLLVGGLGKGGAGLFALDVTDPANPIPKWEYSNPLDMVASRAYAVRFGETWSSPVIGRANLPSKPWAVFVGGGVPPSKDTAGVPWGNLFYVLDARNGSLLSDGTTSAKFTIWDDPADDPNNPLITDHANGVAGRPTLFRPGDGSQVARVYFTDTEGKIWRMDTSSSTVSSWSPWTGGDPFFDPASSNAICQKDVNGQTAQVIDANTGLPVPGATLPLVKPRPKIFNRPILGYDSTGLVNVYVGTGDTEHPNDPPGTQDYFYGITDVGAGCGRPLFVISFAPNEKVLADSVIYNGVLYVTTYLPPAVGPGRCNDAGSGFLYAFDARTGQPTKALTDPYTNNPTAKIAFGGNPQLRNSGIPSAPLIRGNRIFVAFEADPKPRQALLGGQNNTVKVKGWQRVK